MNRYWTYLLVASAFALSALVHLVFGLGLDKPTNELVILVALPLLPLALIYVLESRRRSTNNLPPIWILVVRWMSAHKIGWIIFVLWILYYGASMLSLNNTYEPSGGVIRVILLFEPNGKWGNGVPEYASLAFLGLWMIYIMLKFFAGA